MESSQTDLPFDGGYFHNHLVSAFHSCLKGFAALWIKNLDHFASAAVGLRTSAQCNQRGSYMNFHANLVAPMNLDRRRQVIFPYLGARRDVVERQHAGYLSEIQY